MRRPSDLSVLLLLLLVVAPSLGLANGGSGHIDSTTEGAMLSGDGRRVEKMTLVPEPDVECLSEVLTLTTNTRDVHVDVRYVFQNRGKTKRVAYAFPFALGFIKEHWSAPTETTAPGEAVTPSNDVGRSDPEVAAAGRTETSILGEPVDYSIDVDGSAAEVTVEVGDAVPKDIPVPEIRDNRGEPEPTMPGEPERESPTLSSGYLWSFRVSSIEFPAGKAVKVHVSYRAPYLVYSQRGELGSAVSPGSFSYLLSTGGGWRGGKIGRLRVVLRGGDLPLSRIRPEGLLFTQERGQVSFEATDFTPTPSSNILLQRSDWETIRVQVTPREVLSPGGWTFPAVDRSAPVTLVLEVLIGDKSSPLERASPDESRTSLERFRIGLAEPSPVGASARLKRVRVEYETKDDDRQVFYATFADVPEADVRATGGVRFIYFDEACARPDPFEPRPVDWRPFRFLKLTLLDAYPSTRGDRRVRLEGVTLERDDSNYQASIPVPR